jgi:hypothetical protein
MRGTPIATPRHMASSRRTRRAEPEARVDREISTVDVFEHVIRGVCLSHAWQSLHEAKTLDENVDRSADSHTVLIRDGGLLIRHP